MAIFLVSGVTFLAVAFKWAAADLFTAIDQLKPLVKTHQSVIDELEEYIYNEVDRLQLLNKILKNFKKEHTKMQEDDNYFENPINTYSLIKRLTADLAKIQFHVLQSEFELNTELLYPDDEDLEGAATALWRLQRMYALNVTELAAGKLEGRYSHNGQLYVETTSPLSGSDCHEVGRISYELSDYENAIPWMLEALKKYEKNEPYETLNSFDAVDLVDYLRHSYSGIGDYQSAINYTKRLAKLRTEENYTEILQEYEKLAKEPNTVPRHIPDPDLSLNREDKRKYRLLCRGNVLVPEDKKRRLYCYYQRNSAFLLLAPFRVEQLHRDPDVLLFHDVMSQREITHIQELAYPELQRATVYGDEKVHYRISKFAWLRDEDSSVVARLNSRAEDMSGLSNSFYDTALQVANYGIGGQYDPHFDFMPASSEYVKMFGDRVATVLFYMSDVEQGGATVFLDLEITVFPKKHSAIMWMNLLSSGEHDFRTRHAACPVLRGSKWVSNKWIHAFGQEFRRPCNLEFEENKSQYPNIEYPW